MWLKNGDPVEFWLGFGCGIFFGVPLGFLFSWLIHRPVWDFGNGIIVGFFGTAFLLLVVIGITLESVKLSVSKDIEDRVKRNLLEWEKKQNEELASAMDEADEDVEWWKKGKRQDGEDSESG